MAYLSTFTCLILCMKLNKGYVLSPSVRINDFVTDIHGVLHGLRPSGVEDAISCRY